VQSNTGHAKQQDWKSTYEAAILEADERTIALRISEAQHAIMDRIEDLNHSGDPAECQELSDALTMLRDLARICGINPAPPKAA
jgi:hypothetical protein